MLRDIPRKYRLFNKIVEFSQKARFLTTPQYRTDMTERGVFAVEKPPGYSSAEYLSRVVQLLRRDKRFFNENHNLLSRRDLERGRAVKAGHGGTLDPEAEGVLIIGVNRGTKELQRYLDCQKTYEVIAHFGVATTAYDRDGRVLGYAATNMVTRDRIDQILPLFRGPILQLPPIYSALKMDGKALYHYARDGQALPRAIEPRNVTVYEFEIISDLQLNDTLHSVPIKGAEKLEIIQEHAYRLAALQKLAEAGEKSATLQLDYLKTEQMPAVDDLPPPASPVEPIDMAGMSKKQRKKFEKRTQRTIQKRKYSEAIEEQLSQSTNILTPPAQQYPSIRLKATVSSGTYIRSLVHDLAMAMGTKAYTAELVRTRQGPWKLGKNVLSYAELLQAEQNTQSNFLEQVLHYLENGPEIVFNSCPEGKDGEKSPLLPSTAVQPVCESISTQADSIPPSTDSNSA
ncbi:pseudouridine synthase [Lipomyces oligophaga]|uniref:pseudouridine synthase n=1 Tax=Lipomyces oligophaga TaxID=45792 RepID=UPI0034CF05D2